jgi:hypothetical protein
MQVYCFTPGILRLPNGNLLATMDFGGKELGPYFPGSPVTQRPCDAMPISETFFGRAYLSRDGGRTWQLKAEFPLCHQRAFMAGGRLYILGHRGDIGILVSDDMGESWSEVSLLTQGTFWSQSACSIWQDNGKVYLVMERITYTAEARWAYAMAPVLMAARASDDLTLPESWRYSNEITFPDVVDMERMDYLGFPWEDQPPHLWPGWLETNVVRFTDPAHRLYDESGRTLHLFMRANNELSNLACLLQARDNEDGTLTVGPVYTPKGKKMVYVPLPGGQMKFFILWDEQSGMYWLLSSQSTNLMLKDDKLPKGQFVFHAERYRLALYFSKSCFDWCFAGMVAMGDTPLCSRGYAAMDVDGDDLVVVSRSGDDTAKNPHDTNIITFHRVRRFRDLVY